MRGRWREASLRRGASHRAALGNGGCSVVQQRRLAPSLRGRGSQRMFAVSRMTALLRVRLQRLVQFASGKFLAQSVNPRRRAANGDSGPEPSPARSWADRWASATPCPAAEQARRDDAFRAARAARDFLAGCSVTRTCCHRSSGTSCSRPSARRLPCCTCRTAARLPGSDPSRTRRSVCCAPRTRPSSLR